METLRARSADKKQKLVIFFREGGKCHYCDSELSFNNFHADHIIPYSNDGKTDIDNLVASCYMCNIAKSTMSYKQFRDNLLTKGLDWRRKRYFAIKNDYSSNKKSEFIY